MNIKYKLKLDSNEITSFLVNSNNQINNLENFI